MEHRRHGGARLRAARAALTPAEWRRFGVMMAAVVAINITHADGFSPPTLVREELHARAQQLTKAAKSPTAGLF